MVGFYKIRSDLFTWVNDEQRKRFCVSSGFHYHLLRSGLCSLVSFCRSPFPIFLLSTLICTTLPELQLMHICNVTQRPEPMALTARYILFQLKLKFLIQLASYHSRFSILFYFRLDDALILRDIFKVLLFEFENTSYSAMLNIEKLVPRSESVPIPFNSWNWMELLLLTELIPQCSTSRNRMTALEFFFILVISFMLQFRDSDYLVHLLISSSNTII